MILNLEKLNKNISILNWRHYNWFFSLDLRNAYFSVHVHDESQNYLKFEWFGQLYRFTAFPNGLTSAPRLFTKLLRPVMAHIHRQGYL